jgi:GAF domain-containing protein
VIRELRIPLGKGTIFDQVVEERRLFAGKPPAQPLLHRLLTRLGGPVPFEIVLAPIAVQGRVVALLYGDQVPTQAPLRDLEVLEVFLAQAGLALERAYLRRQLLQKNRKGGE